METLVELNSTSKRTRVVARQGDTVVLRAVTTLLEALSLWTDGRLCVALSAATLDDCFRFEQTDELGVGVRSVYYEVVKRAPRRRRLGADVLEGAR
jgi:hypothetical protein